MGGQTDVAKDKKVKEELQFTGRCMGGLRDDIGRRGPVYLSDWTDAFKGENIQVTLASTMFLFFACISPAIAFGALFDDGTEGNLGAFEMILSSAMSGIVYAFFAGQPLCIMGATGPELAYTVVYFNMCKSLDLEFMPARWWCGMWCALMTIIMALTDFTAIMKYVTRYTEDIFSALISMIFIIEAIINVIKQYNEVSIEGFFLTVLLAAGSFMLAMFCRSFKGSKWLNVKARKMVGNFGVTVAVISFACLYLLFEHTDGVQLTTLNMPDTFEPTLVVNAATGERRPWIVNPMGTNNDFPVWGIFFAIGPAIGLCILGFLDQNLTSLLINRTQHKLKKKPAYHLDLLVTGFFIYPICSIFGLPFTHAATIRSLTHLISLTQYEIRELADGTKKPEPKRVNEQRVTQLGIHVLIALSSLASSVLKKLPVAVLYGVFLYMGVSTIAGNDLFDRMSLWLIWDPSKYPKFKSVERLYKLFPEDKSYNHIQRLHFYTFIQFVLLVILYVLKEIKQIAVVFPFFLIVIAVVFILLVPMGLFKQEEVDALDGDSDDEKDDTKPAEEAKGITQL